MAEQGETVTQVRDRLFLACRGLPTLARAYTVGDTALLVVSADDGTWPRYLAWLEYEGVKVCFVATGAEELSLFDPLFGGEFPALEYFAIHESLEQAWYCLSTGGDGTRASGQHHRNRALGAYAKACLRNLRRRIAPARCRIAPARCRDGCSCSRYLSAAAAESAARAAAAALASWTSVDLLVPDGRTPLEVARLWARCGVIKRKWAAEARIRGRGARRNRK